ncbi:hypothetical protein GCM10023340_19600 [Nocardioides marinquilinus]|uniref:TerD domain-containing protein n=1 Tax=Nocardioides marinquilinus TaxID=1210400 RepID=A0ABP9PMK1_9ACTN
MTELQSGQNRPWPDRRATAYVAGADVVALLLGPDGRAVDGVPWVGAGTAGRDGVEHLPGPTQGVTVDLDAVGTRVAKVLVVVSGFAAAPTAQLLASDGGVVGTVTPQRLTTERSLVMAELYRRDGAWKVRALGLGHSGGLAELARLHGAPEPAGATPPAPPPPPPPPPSPAPPPSAPSPAAGGVQDPVRRIGMILDDASRTTASFESSRAFADRRHEQELEHLVGNPELRMGPRADAARAEAQRRRDELVEQARQRHATDLAQLTAELADLARTLPPSLAPWDAPGWHEPGATHEPPWALLVGELSLESAPGFRLPMVRHLPLAPPLWIETEDGGDVTAARMMASLATRLMVATPRAPRLSVIDVGGRSALGHLPSSAPPATDATAASAVVAEHVRHLELVALAAQSGGLADLPPDQRPGRVLLVTDFPGGLDDSAVNGLAHLVRRGPDAGVSVVLAGRRPASLGIAVLDLVHESCLRVPTTPGGDLVDAYGGVTWVFHPDLGPADPFTADRVRATVDLRVAERDAG